jgi:hypothetical protein
MCTGIQMGGAIVTADQETHSRPNRSSLQPGRTTLMPLLILPLLSMLLMLLLASCGANGSQARAAEQGNIPPAGHVATPTPPVSPCPPTQEQSPASLPCIPCPPGPPTAPPTCFPCPPEREIPCPVVSPVPTPRPGLSTIVFCPNPPVPVQGTSGAIQLRGSVCGRGFHPAELVTLTASGSRERLAWQIRADQAGAFIAPLPPLLCRFVPLTLMATGNEGSRSNTLSLGADACPPTV